MQDSLKIMHGLSEVAGQNYLSVRGLREIGEDAETAVWDKHAFGYPYDICLGIDKHKKYLLPIYAIKLAAFFVTALFRFNTFHFHYGRSILNNHELWLYDLIGKQYFYEFHGSDLRDYERFCRNSAMPFTADLAMHPKLKKRNEIICKKAKQIILHDDELIPYLPAIHSPIQVIPLRVDLSLFHPQYPSDVDTGTVRIVHAPSKRSSKGTDFVIGAINRLKERYPEVELILVEGKTQEEAKAIYATADIVVDQLLIGTYGVFSVESMALGKPVVTYITDAMKERLPEELPIVSASVDTVESALESLICNARLRHDLGVKGRRYAETYHDYKKVATVLRKIYNGECKPATGREAFERVKNVPLE